MLSSKIKSELPSGLNIVQSSRHAAVKRICVMILFLCLGYRFLSLLHASVYGTAQRPISHQGKPWRWHDIIASKELVWHDCHDGFECAKVDLPLDWLEPTNHSRIALAIIRLPASDRENYKGSVFTNPGGPGGSGIHSMRDHGKAMQTIVGRNFDLLSFDPRGIGQSTPSIKCFSSEQNEKLWSMQQVGTVDSHPGVMYDYYARESAVSKSCASSIGDGDTSHLRFISTTSVARDMLEILHLLGSEKMRYWGFSYGTVLGGLFASLYPEKVERMVNDGNVDLREWFSGTHLNFLNDTDKVMDSFYHFCHLAGPSECSFYADTPGAISLRLDNLLQNIRLHPVIVSPTPQSMDLPEVISFSSIKRLLSAALYRPIVMFPPLAQVLSSLETGDGAPYIELVTSQGFRQPFSCSKPSDSFPDDDNLEEDEGSDNAFKTIVCTDSDHFDVSVEAMEEYSQVLQKTSKAAGAVNTLFRISCAGWKIKAKWRYLGPFSGNTSHPILFISNSADNVTPLRSARNNARGFPGSVILVQQESFGHTTLASPSVCTASKIRAYFQTGELPGPETLCKADKIPFGLPSNDTKALTMDEAELDHALSTLLNSARLSPL